MRSSSTSLLLLLLLCPLVVSPTHANEKFEILINKTRDAIDELARKVQAGFQGEAFCSSAETCSEDPCIPHGCASSGFGKKFTCSHRVTLVNQSEHCNSQCSNLSLLSEDAFYYSLPESADYENSKSEKIILRDENLLREACTLKRIATDIPDIYDKHNLKSWLYAGTIRGSYVVFPGTPLRYTSENSLNKCGYVPNDRPWFTTSISGPKNVVFLFDRNIILQNNRNVLQQALERSINHLDHRDNVSVIPFHNGIDVLNNADSLQPASKRTKQLLIEDVRELRQPTETVFPNILLPFEKAFDLLKLHSKATGSTSCSNIIVLLLGSKPSCSQVCKNLNPGDCTCTSEIVKAINKYRDDFNGAVSILSLTEFLNKDTYDDKNSEAERIARSIVCEGDRPGIWRGITNFDTDKNATLILSQFSGISRHEEDQGIFASEIYYDHFGNGEMFTISRPVYANHILLGVVAADITLKYATEQVGNRKDVNTEIDVLNKKLRSCRFQSKNSCDMQAMRRGSPHHVSGECADNLLEYKCYQLGGTLFMHKQDLKTWDDAAMACKEITPNASLARVNTTARNKALAGIFSYDGSWIGVRALLKGELKWKTGDIVSGSFPGFSSYPTQAINALHENREEDACVTADRRGIEANWNIVSCKEKRAYICEFPLENNIEKCEGNVFDGTARKNRFPDNPKAQQKGIHNTDCESYFNQQNRNCDEKTFANANPFCPDSTRKFTYKDRFCCEGKANSGLSPRCNAPSTGGRLSVWIIIAVIIAVAAVLLVLIVLWCRRNRLKLSIPKPSIPKPTERVDTAHKLPNTPFTGPGAVNWNVPGPVELSPHSDTSEEAQDDDYWPTV